MAYSIYQIKIAVDLILKDNEKIFVLPKESYYELMLHVYLSINHINELSLETLVRSILLLTKYGLPHCDYSSVLKLTIEYPDNLAKIIRTVSNLPPPKSFNFPLNEQEKRRFVEKVLNLLKVKNIMLKFSQEKNERFQKIQDDSIRENLYLLCDKLLSANALSLTIFEQLLNLAQFEGLETSDVINLLESFDLLDKYGLVEEALGPILNIKGIRGDSFPHVAPFQSISFKHIFDKLPLALQSKKVLIFLINTNNGKYFSQLAILNILDAANLLSSANLKLLAEKFDNDYLFILSEYHAIGLLNQKSFNAIIQNPSFLQEIISILSHLDRPKQAFDYIRPLINQENVDDLINILSYLVDIRVLDAGTLKKVVENKLIFNELVPILRLCPNPRRAYNEISSLIGAAKKHIIISTLKENMTPPQGVSKESSPHFFKKKKWGEDIALVGNLSLY